MYEYPFGNGQQLNLDWFLNEWKNLLAAWEAEKNGIDGALQAEIDRAEAALADVFAARDAAAQSAANALESKNAAAQSAEDTSGYLATVRADANTASNAARNAAQSQSNAAESAQTALASKNTAANSERNAAQSEANANSSKNAAAQSASDADASKSAAAQSAAEALAHKDAAAQSAEDASDAAASVETSAQQITTNANDIISIKDALFDSFPSRVTPINKSQENQTENGAVKTKNLFFDITPALGTGVCESVNNVILPPGKYNVIIDAIENTLTPTAQEPRVGYLCIVINGAISLITNIKNDSLPVGKYIKPFTLSEESSISIRYTNLFIGTGHGKIFCYIDVATNATNTAALSLATKDTFSEAKDTFSEAVEETK